MSNEFFFNRRSGTDRRKGKEQRQNPRLDLSHKRRRKSDERRNSMIDNDKLINTINSRRPEHNTPGRKH